MFFFRVFNCSFLLFESIRQSLARYQKLVFPWKYYFEYVNLIKQWSLGVNFWGTNCPKFQKFSLGKLILLELIQKKYLRSFPFIVWLGKLIHLWNLMRYSHLNSNLLDIFQFQKMPVRFLWIVYIRKNKYLRDLGKNFVLFFKIFSKSGVNSRYVQMFLKPFKCQFHKMVKHTQAIRRQFADKLFECVWPFCEIGA